MFSFNQGKRGNRPIASLKARKGITPIYLGGDYPCLDVPKGGSVTARFNPEKRVTMFIAGAQGCGKSFFIADILKQLRKDKPDRPIILFTGLDEKDKNFAGLPIKLANLDRITEFTIEGLRFNGRGSICVFDDIDRIRDSKKLKAVHDLALEILSNGRDHKTQSGKADIDIIVSNHEINDYRRTKYYLSDSEYVVLFPQATTYQQMDIILKKIGVDSKIAESIKKSPSRNVIIHKNYPLYYISSHKISQLRE